MEQTLHQRNNQWNAHGTSSLKALANKLLEQNKKRNKPGTEPLKSVPPMPQSSPACGASSEVVCKVERDDLLYEYNERAAIAEYDGHQTRAQAQGTAYLDAFMAVLADLPYKNVEDDWMEHRIKAAHKWLLDQGIEQAE